MEFFKIIKLLLSFLIIAFSAISLTVLSFAENMGFVPRETAPAAEDTVYSENFFAVYVAEMPNCTTYAYGRAWEILGHEPDLCHGSAVHWFDNNGVSSNSNDSYERGDEPQIGAIACWDMGNYGHVSVVEKISGDMITVSESDNLTPIF